VFLQKKINNLFTRFVPYRISIVNEIKYNLGLGVWPDFLASDFTFILAFEEIGFELGLFFWSLSVVHFHNPL